jgi:hypothetical protein
VLTIEFEDMSVALSKSRHEQEDLKSTIATLQERIQKEVASASALTAAHLQEKEQLRASLDAVEGQLRRCPPTDFARLLDRLGIYEAEVAGEAAGEGGGSRGASSLSWGHIEKLLVQTVRKANAEAVELRGQFADQSVMLSKAREELDSLRQELEGKSKAVGTLERELSDAFASIEASKALLRCHKIENASRPVAATKKGSGLSASEVAQASLSALLSDSGSSSGGASSEAVLRGAGGNEDSAMLRAVLDQRDRMMKSVGEKEQELQLLRAQLERAQEEKNSLHHDNSELYKRLRVLRVGGAVGAGASGREEVAGGVGKGSRTLSKRRGEDRDSGGVFAAGLEDDLEVRYAANYESQLDPFHLQEMDRLRVLSRFNVCERSLASIMRLVMQDQWMRHAFLVYLLLVHVFAIGYVVIVLNPELDSEIGAIENQFWSSGEPEAIDGTEWESHPDVR